MRVPPLPWSGLDLVLAGRGCARLLTVLKGADVMRVSYLFCACVWLFLPWRVHAIVYLFCACLGHAWALCMLGLCMLHALGELVGLGYTWVGVRERGIRVMLVWSRSGGVSWLGVVSICLYLALDVTILGTFLLVPTRASRSLASLSVIQTPGCTLWS
jgi:hypothetical protein